MSSFEKLDAWKGCFELVIATYRATDPVCKRDPDLIGRLRGAALRAVGRVAFGAGSADRRIFHRALYHVQGWLWTFAAHLEVARVMGVLPQEACVNLDALRGRAAFYTMRQLERAMRPDRGR